MFLHVVACREPVKCPAVPTPAAAKPASWQCAEEYVLDQQSHCSTLRPASSGHDDKEGNLSPGTSGDRQPSKTLTFDDDYCSSPLVRVLGLCLALSFHLIAAASAPLIVGLSAADDIAWMADSVIRLQSAQTLCLEFVNVSDATKIPFALHADHIQWQHAVQALKM